MLPCYRGFWASALPPPAHTHNTNIHLSRSHSGSLLPHVCSAPTDDRTPFWARGQNLENCSLKTASNMFFYHLNFILFRHDATALAAKGSRVKARFYNPYRWPLSTVGRFRLGGQVLLGIENISLAPRWAETKVLKKRW